MPTLAWETAADWDNAQSEDGVVHESVANTDHDDASVVKQGYAIQNPYLSATLAAYWTLQENSGSAIDFSGQNNDGNVSGPTQGAAGLLGTSSYSFNGSGDTVEVNAEIVDGAAGSAYSISYWVLTTQTGSSNGHDWSNPFMLESRGYSNNNRQFAFELRSDGGVEFGVPGTNVGATVSNSEAINDGNWHHVVGVRNDDAADDYTLYIDTISTGTSDQNAGAVDSNVEVHIAHRETDSGSDTSYFAGRLADIRVYDHALSAAEVQTLYDVVASAGVLTTAKKAA